MTLVFVQILSDSLSYAESINEKIRNHWSVENNLHWMLDVVFGEGASRERKGNSAQNFNLISKIALFLITQEKTKSHAKKANLSLTH